MYAGVIAQQAVIVSQLLPLLTSMKAGIMAVATAENIKAVATTAATTATKIATAATAVFNAVMSANPVSLVVLAIGALVAAFIAAYNNSEEFRKIVDTCWASVKAFAKVIWDNLVVAFEKVKSVITSVWNTLVDLFGGTKKAEEATTELAESQVDLADNTDKAASSADKQAAAEARAKAAMAAKLQTIGGLEDKIKELEKAQKTATDSEALAIQGQINKYNTLLNTKKRALAGVGMKTPDKVTASKPLEFKGMDTSVKINTTDLKKASEQVFAMDKSLYKLGGTLDDVMYAWSDASVDMRLMEDPMDSLKSGFASVAQSMVSSLGSGAESLQSFAGVVANTARDVIGALISEGVAHLVKNAMATAGNLGPFGFLAGAGFAATAGGIAKSAFNSLIPAFADGGIISGPTVGLMGEYPGAANNPEVVAPLNKLKSLMQPAGDFGDGQVVFRIEKDALVGVFKKDNNRNKRIR